MLYKAAGSYVGGLFQNAIKFLLPIGAFGFIFKEVNRSDGISKDIKLERKDGFNDSDELLTFTFADKNSDDIAQMSVSRNGIVKISADDESDEQEIDKYSAEIENNRGQLFE